MKVRVTGCTRPTFWYRDRIGEEFKVVRAVKYPQDFGCGFEVKIDGLKKYIDIDDAEVVFEEF